MSAPARTTPVKDTVPKIENELAVGEDLEFQRRWWRFEHIIWICFVIILGLDLAGVLGRGPLARAKAETLDGAMIMNYDRFERFQTPSIVTIHFAPQAVHDGKIQLWVSQTMIKGLGNQRVVPQPLTSALSQNGILYTFPSGSDPDDVEFALEPGSIGVHHFTVRLPGLGDQLTRHVLVYP